MTKAQKLIVFVKLILIGPALFYFAEIDDSPGGQLIGVVVVLSGLYGLFKTFK